MTVDGNKYRYISTDENNRYAIFNSEKSDIKSIPNNSQFNTMDILDVTLSNSVTTIGDNAFSYINILTVFNSLKQIGSSAFRDVSILISPKGSYAREYFSSKGMINKYLDLFLFYNRDDVLRCTDINATNSTTKIYADYFSKQALTLPISTKTYYTLFTFDVTFKTGVIFTFECNVKRIENDKFTIDCYYQDSGAAKKHIDGYPATYPNFYEIMLQIFAAIDSNVVGPYNDNILDGNCYSNW